MPAATIAQRVIEPEQMDDPGIDPKRHRQALRGLARLNRLSGVDRHLWSILRDAYRAQYPDGGRMRVLDLACGAGDVTCRMALHAEHAGMQIDFQGCDIAYTAIQAARQAATRYECRAVFFQHDALLEPFPEDYDLVLINLFLHHLTNEQATQLLWQAGQLSPRLLVSDLERSSKCLHAVRAAARLVTRSPVVHFDAPASVRAAFTEAELTQIAKDAELEDSTVTRSFPCRLLLKRGLD